MNISTKVLFQNNKCVICQNEVGRWDKHIKTQGHISQLNIVIDQWQETMYVIKLLYLLTTTRTMATEENPDDPNFTPVPDVLQRSESDEEMEEDVVNEFLPPTLKYIPPTPKETKCPRNAHKYFTLENKFLCRIWLQFPGKATGIFFTYTHLIFSFCLT